MPTWRPERQIDLLQRVTLEVEQGKLPPAARVAVIELLKALLTTCVARPAAVRADDE
jgi:hypothetical protein